VEKIRVGERKISRQPQYSSRHARAPSTAVIDGQLCELLDSDMPSSMKQEACEVIVFHPAQDLFSALAPITVERLRAKSPSRYFEKQLTSA
jgi:hypothetical protein